MSFVSGSKFSITPAHVRGVERTVVFKTDISLSLVDDLYEYCTCIERSLVEVFN